MHNFILGLVTTVVLLVFLLLAFTVGINDTYRNITHDCANYGATSINGTIYTCKEKL